MDRINGAGNVGRLFVPEDVATNRPPTEVTAEFLNAVQEELCAIVEYLGGVLDPNNNGQVLAKIIALIESRVGDYSLDTGAANAYVIALNPAIAVYAGNFSGRFKAVNANTGAATLNAGGGVVPLVNDVGGALVAGDIPAGSIVSYEYIHADGKAYITSMVPSQTISQTAADARYAKLAGLATQLFSVAAATGQDHALALGQLIGSLGTNGYIKIPLWTGAQKQELILQWGQATSTATNIPVTLPLTFPNGTFIAFAQDAITGGNPAGLYGLTWRPDLSNNSTLNFWNGNGANLGLFQWIAIGW